jgi:hypothetical protein
MKILAWGGSHGPPEETGLRLASSLKVERINGVEAEIANELAVQQGLRYCTRNLATAFPGDKNSTDYETIRPAEIIERSNLFDVVIDVHDRPDSVGEYVMLGHNSAPGLLGVATLLGINRAIIVGPKVGLLVNYVSQAIVVDMARGNQAEQVDRNVQRLRYCMSTLALMDRLPSSIPHDLEFYKYVQEIRTENAYELGLQRYNNIQPFGRLPDEVNQCLGAGSDPLYAEYWNGISSSSGEYFGGVLQRIDNPFGMR